VTAWEMLDKQTKYNLINYYMDGHEEQDFQVTIRDNMIACVGDEVDDTSTTFDTVWSIRDVIQWWNEIEECDRQEVLQQWKTS